MIKSKLQKGFGLLETLIAASILSMVVAGAVALVNSSLRRSSDYLDRSVAINLSQEAIELLRSSRDSTYIDEIFDAPGVPNKWYEPIKVFGGPFKLITEKVNNVDYYRLISSPNGEEIKLGDNSYFRKIYVEKINFNYPQLANLPNASSINQDEIVRLVKVEVSWGSGSRQKIETSGLFTNWRFGN